MITPEQLELAHQGLVAHKEHMWRNHGERDMSPRIATAIHGAPEMLEVDAESLAEYLEDGHSLADAIRIMDDTIPDDLRDKLAQVWVGIDAYSAIRDNVDDLERGRLRDQFMTEPDPGITECIITIVASDDRCGGCDIQSLRQPYTITDGGRIKWGDKAADGDFGGDVTDAINELFKREWL